MSSAFSGLYANGETLRIEPVELRVEAGRLYLTGPGRSLDYSLGDIRASDRLGRVPRFLYLPNRGTIETGDHWAVDALVALQDRGQLSRLIHWLEARARVAATATVMLTVIAVAAVYFGLPVLTRRAAYAVPAAIEQQAGRAALATFNRYLAPSQLGAADRRRVQGLLDQLGRKQHLTRPPVMEFRSMGGKFPNAFALPGGIIIVSDELVTLAGNDQELMAVLAHELGHIEHRHGLQSVLRNSAALLLVSTVTGDLSTITSFAGSIPLTLLQRGYSREFEEEADAYAVNLLRTAGIDVAHFAAILKKLEETRPTQGQDFSYLSTHPATGDRIRRINPDGHLPPASAKATAPPAESPRSKATTFRLPTGNDTAGRQARAGKSPRPLSQPPPAYPFEMSALKVEGSVTVEFIIDKNGDVSSAHVVRSTHQEFEAPAIAAILQWKFVPGELEGRKVDTVATQTIEFNLDNLPANPAPSRN